MRSINSCRNRYRHVSARLEYDFENKTSTTYACNSYEKLPKNLLKFAQRKFSGSRMSVEKII